MNVSVIMNSLNENEEYFDTAVRSILNNDINIHLILSTIEGDPSLKYIDKFAGDIDIVTCTPHAKNVQGSFRQLNNALPLIKNDYFSFASSNDMMTFDKYRTEITKMRRKGHKVCYSAYYLTDDDFNIRKKQEFMEYNYNSHLQGNYVYDCSTIETKTFKKYMPFSTKYYNMGFWDLWLRMYLGEGDIFIYNPIPVMYYRQNDDSMHIKRRNDPKKMQEYKEQRELFIQQYR